ncbi:MAG: hypothetical protein ACE366_05155 [Bradymonadia bacterium]
MSWADVVWSTLFPDSEALIQSSDHQGVPRNTRRRKRVARQIRHLRQSGLIASDIAFRTWLELNPHAEDTSRWMLKDMPWTAARHQTRSLWFWSRALHGPWSERRPDPAHASNDWQGFLSALRANPPQWHPESGLKTLALMIATGNVLPPWALDCELTAFRDTWEQDMGYVDAWRLWGYTVVDDLDQLRDLSCLDEAPDEGWRTFIRTQFTPPSLQLIHGIV